MLYCGMWQSVILKMCINISEEYLAPPKLKMVHLFPEDGGETLIWIFGTYLSSYVSSHPKTK
jgi:hypothetical protein